MSRLSLLACCFVLSVGLSLPAQTPPLATITTPKQFFGFNIGDDYMMANYTQAIAYWHKLAEQSDRIKLVEIGKTSEGRAQWMAILSSPENLAQLDRYREISHRLALAQDLTPAQAHALAAEGKAVVWIDGGLHSNETVGTQQLIETVYQLASATDPETLRELHDDIVLCVFDNPDGVEMITDWYMREPVPAKRVSGPTGNTFFQPFLWNHYAGHDDNRDFFMSNLEETTNINRVLFREWSPQIMYNHHQPGPPGLVIFVPPFRDPFNYHYDPLVVLKIQSVGTAVHSRFVEENKPGSGMRSNATYSTWYNGGLRTVTYFHNMVGILTEIVGGPSPIQLPLLPAKQLPNSDTVFPAPPGPWHYRQSIDYELSANRAILDYASRNRESLLYDTYAMGANSIAKGNEDSWTITPKRITALEEAAASRQAPGPRSTAAPTEPLPGGLIPVDSSLYKTVLHDPAHRDPRGYILSADQPDFPTVTKFVNTFLKNGVSVLQATAPFEVAGKHYPAGSYVVKTAQAFRPQVLDMFEPQDHPNDFRYPGGPPVPPYDATGYTLALQMGVHFDRVYEGFDGPFAPITSDLAPVMPGRLEGTPGKRGGYLISHAYNDAFILTNRLLKARCVVEWLQQPVQAAGTTLAPGALWIPATPVSTGIVRSAVHDLGLSAYGVDAAPPGPRLQLHAPRIALYDQYGGLMPTGWLRYLLEHFEFPYERIYPQAIDAGNLRAKYDVIVFPDGGIGTTAFVGGMGRTAYSNNQPDAKDIPAEYRSLLGVISADKSIPQIKAFAEAGGEVITIGSSNRLAGILGLPVLDALTEEGADGKAHPLPSTKFYIPGSLIKANFDVADPVAFGMAAGQDVFFDNSPAFRLAPEATLQGVKAIGWYGEGNLLDSGWAWGQQYLQNTLAAVDLPVGKGSLLLLGPEVTFRGQPHGTFKLFFNGVLLSTAVPQR